MADVENLLQEANAALENGEDPEIVRRRLVEVENVNSRRNARIQLCLARCYLLQAKSQNDIDRINKLKNCENWINKSLSNFESFEGLVIKCYLLGIMISESCNVFQNRDRAVEIYRNLIKMEKIKKEDDDIYLIRGILFFHTSELTTLQKMTAKTLFPDTKPLINEASFEKAISIFKKCKKTSIEKFYYLANCYAKTKNKPKAIKYYNALLNKKAKNAFEEEFKIDGKDELKELKRN